MEAGALAQSGHEVESGEVKAETAGTHSEAQVSGKRSPRQGVHRRRRYFPSRTFAALGFRAWSRSARSLPRATDGESIAIHVFPAVRRRPERRKDKLQKNARARLFSRNAGARRRPKARIPSDRRDASAWARRSGRRGPGKENARGREGTR